MLEIERKFLIDYAKYIKFLGNGTIISHELIEQIYLSINPDIRIREAYDGLSNGINNGICNYTLTFKNGKGIIREKNTILIERNHYDVLKELSKFKAIYKERESAFFNGYIFEVDSYLNDLSGLCIAEIEFKNIEDADSFRPYGFDFIIKEVTLDERYKNKNLAVCRLSKIKEELNIK